MKLRVSDDLALGEDFVVSTAGIFATKGMGKCLGPEVEVLHFDGRVTRADAVLPGDTLMGPDSAPRRVLSIARGRSPMFTILPVKGEPWRCNESHVLTLKHTTTGEVIDIGLDKFLTKTKDFQRLHFLFSTGVDFPSAEQLPLDPYFLGVWYGDGDKTVVPGLGLTRVAVTSIDREVEDACRTAAFSKGLQLVVDEKPTTLAKRYRIVNERGAGNELLSLMRSVLGETLTVPRQYLLASRPDRLAFLAGWIDADGSLECGCFDFVQKRRDWVDSVIFLARSLGFRATVAPKIVNGETYWRICLSGNVSEIPTRLPHKRAEERRQRKDPMRTGFRVIPEGEGDYFGFMVDGDGRFLLGDFTVTHNSHLAQVMAEELLAQGHVMVAIDPTDSWWGLRSSADGQHDGYPIVVIGGDHGDLKLEPDAGPKLAEAIVAERFSCVLCTDGLSDTAEIKFVREFLDTLYRKNREPLHVFVDEGDIFAPQKPFEVEDSRCIRAMSHIVRRGRRKGIGSTVITQRPSELNASVRSQVEMLFVLGMLNNLDIDAVEKWLRLRKKKSGSNASFALQEKMIDSLDTLQQGDAWVWAPRKAIHKLFRAREKRTFDSGATPKPGKRARIAKRLAPVDIARLGEAIAEAVQRQKDSDPIELRKQVAVLRRELDRVGKGQDRAEANEKANHADNIELRIEVAELRKRLAASSAVKPSDLKRLEKTIARAETMLDKHDKSVSRHHDAYGAALENYTKTSKAVTSAAMVAIDDLRSKLAAPTPLPPAKNPSRVNDARLDKPAPPRKEAAIRTTGAAGPLEVFLQPAHLRLLSAIAWWESIGVPEPDLVGVAFVAKTSVKSSAFDNNRSRLRAAGYIDYPSAGRARLTDAGRAVAPPPEIPPTNEALQKIVLDQVSPAIGRMLRVLLDDYPSEISLADWADRAGASVTSSAFDNNRSWLRARGFATYPRTGFARATELLFPEAS